MVPGTQYRHVLNEHSTHLGIGDKLMACEHWLLETATESPIPICSVHGKDVEARFNKNNHGLDRDGVLETLERLYSQGLIEAFRANRDETPVTLSRGTIDAALNEPGPLHCKTCLYYRLTLKGGTSWELFAGPDWNKFIYFDGLRAGCTRQTTFSACADKLRLQQYLDGLHYVNIIPYPESIAWTVEQPWQATYWKRLPIGHKATYCCRDSVNRMASWDQVPKAYMDIYDPQWYKRAT